MSEKVKDRKFKLFDSYDSDPQFSDDLRVFSGASNQFQEKITSFFTSRGRVFDQLRKSEVKSLIQGSSCSKDDIEDALCVLLFILKRMAARKLSAQDVIDDVSHLDFPSEQTARLESFLRSVTEKHPKLADEMKLIRASQSTLDGVRALNFAVDVRAVYDDDDQLVNVVPLLIVRLGLESSSKYKDSDVVFQVNGDALNHICELFDEQRKKMSQAAEVIKIKGNIR